MKPWWRKEIEQATASADRAEQVQRDAEVFGAVVADGANRRAKTVENQLRKELVANGFADALRAAFGGAGAPE